MNPFDPRVVALVRIWTAYWLTHGWPVLVAAFLIGSIPFGLVVSRMFFKTDIRSAGSGNIGAANALRTMGRGPGIAVLFLDALKGVIAYRLADFSVYRHLVTFPGPGDVPNCFLGCDPMTWILGLLCVFTAIVGHCYSPWLRFAGGKGVATWFGALIVMYWPAAVGFSFVWLAVVIPAGFASLGSILATLVAVAIIASPDGFSGSPTLYYTVPIAALIVWKHRQNIARLFAGSENRIDLLGR